ncbi:hypothetical protein [Lactobacillus sp.]|uniref:hypothetical protein n=1 Tax=Lactobacillus sp. TaxID=1591 RepID=UPI0019B261CB|nr:hypothetical protein [Lactobacillus sp.]MBD5429159.1 hypothetical protein [Lactobacillus sp.]
MNDIQKAVEKYSKLQVQKEKIIKKTQPEIDSVSKKVANEKEHYQQLLKAQENSQFIPIIVGLVVMIILLICFSGIF